MADRAAKDALYEYRSLRRLATLPDATTVWPTHGAGSFCSAPPGTARITTIGAEKTSNALLAAPDEGDLAASEATDRPADADPPARRRPRCGTRRR